jgi:Leucine-rich repeat (LRR) protein
MAGSLPLSLSTLDRMEALMMDNNGFSGDITTMVQNMPLLENLFVAINNLSGTVGDTFLNFNPSLSQVGISDNDMVGVLPSHYFDGQSMPNLQLLDLRDNRLSGVLPDCASGNNLLRSVALQGNSLSGSIPISWTQNLRNLDHLDLSSNELEGPMTPELGNMTSLKYLSLSKNQFDAGPIPDSLPSSQTCIIFYSRVPIAKATFQTLLVPHSRISDCWI